MTFKSESHVNMFTDMMSEGFIVINHKGRIQIYNQKAKEIFGISKSQQISHEKGSIKEGDLVIIGDNSVGQDDGNLDSRSLEMIGIKNSNVHDGDAVVAIGNFGGKGNAKPMFRALKKGHGQDRLSIRIVISGIDIAVSIDFINKLISIIAGDSEYRMNYLNAIGHMVVLDGLDMEMKFYQAQGYTARGESINDLLKGGEYRAKGKDTEILDVIGKDIFEIHESGSMIQQFLNVAKGKNIIYVDKFEEINGIPTMCTLLPVEDDGKRIGAALKVEDISQIKKIIAERDYAISELEKAESRLLDEKALDEAFPNFIGNSQQIDNVKRMALKASKTNSNVLLLGESGTGKNVLARSIHQNSRLKDRAFIHVNCGAIPDSLLESELFGYERGAFTGASTEGKKGFFELADGGTLFLDEIGDINQNLQIKILQAIQEKSFYRVGGTDKISVNIRIISATNKNLEDEMQQGKFRDDLYYRINVFPIWIPPLRERKQDIIALIDYLLPKICTNIGCKIKRVSGEAINLLIGYDWPGNIRELENILERGVNLAEGYNILSKHITIKPNKAEVRNNGITGLKEFLDVQEKAAIINALDFYRGDRKKAIKALNISKTTFYDKLKKHEIQ